MNTFTTDNNISAILDTKDGEAFLANFRKVFGPKLLDDLRSNLAKSGMAAANEDMGTLFDEALMVVGSFIEVGRRNDVNSTAPYSDEKSRTAVLMAVVVTLFTTVTFRRDYERFIETVNKHGDGNKAKELMALLLWLSMSEKAIKDEGEQTQRMLNNIAGAAYNAMLDAVQTKYELK